MSALRSFGPYALALSVLLLVAMRMDVRAPDVEAVLRAKPLGALSAFACFLVQSHLSVRGFRSLLLAAGQPAPAGLRVAYATSVLAKYVPGGIWQIAGRVTLLGRLGVSRPVAIAASLFEHVFAVVCCLAFALAAEAAARTDNPATGAMYGAAIAAGGFVACIAGARLATGLWHRVAGPDVAPLPWRLAGLLRSVAWFAGALLAFGAGYLLMLGAATGNAAGEGLYDRAAAVYFGTFAGLAIVFVPGGVGVREGVAASLSNDAAAVLAAMLVARLLIVASELAYFALARSSSR